MSDIKNDNEKEFQRAETHAFPLALKIAWAALIIWGIIYFIIFAFPDLKNYL